MGNLEVLDKIDQKKADPQKMIDFITDFPQMCLDAHEISRKYTIPSYYIKTKQIVLAGMGGSGAANDVVKDLLEGEIKLPIQSIHGYHLPAYVGRDTLVIISSYSGDTEEVIEVFVAAQKADAKIIVITTGGKLKKLAEKYRIPVFLFELTACPRASFPYLFIILLSIFEKLAFVQISGEHFHGLIETLESARQKYLPSASLFGNPAKILAEKIYAKIPLIIASDKLSSVARRFKNQINENAKQVAFCESIPELNHNLIEGFGNPANSQLYVIMMESNFEYARNNLRENITAEIIRKSKTPLERIRFVHIKDRLVETLQMVMFGDFVSYYLALLNRENPSSNENISNLKNRLI